MLPAVDHLVYAAPDLESGIEALAAQLGVRAQYGGKHTSFGTHNALLALGGRSYLEIIAPDPDQPTPAAPLPFGLGGLREPALAAWAMAVTDIESRAAAARDAGFEPGPVVQMSRTLPDAGGELRWRLALRRDRPGGGLVPFLIQWDTEPHPATTSPGGCTLTDLAAEHPHPGEVAAMFSALGVSVPIVEAARPALIATIEGPNGTVVLT
jgi:hypothetical protein